MSKAQLAARSVTVKINLLRSICSSFCFRNQKLANSGQTKQENKNAFYWRACVPFLLNQVIRRCVSLLSLRKDYTLKLRHYSARIVLLWMTFLFDVGGSNLFFYSFVFLPRLFYYLSAVLCGGRPPASGFLHRWLHTSKGACG